MYMNKETTTFGLKSKKLAQLWDIRSEEEEGANKDIKDKTKAELLCDRLAQKISIEDFLARILPKAFAETCKNIQPFTGNSYGALLNDPLTDITILEKIKEDSKKLAQHKNSDVEYEIITVIYYAAIASALFYHDEKITSFSYDHLKDKYVSLLNDTWLTADLRNLFQEALNFCSRELQNEKNNNS